MNNYITHAMQEFKAAGWLNEDGTFKDDMQEMICNHVLKLLEIFHGEGHSGTSAPYTISLFEKLANFKPLVPLTGEDWEWAEVSYGVFQNKRCSHVFKQTDRFNGQAYDIKAVIFYTWHTNEKSERYKSYFTSRNSHQPITFPYTPTHKYREAS